MAIKVPKELKQSMVASIRRYFEEQMDDEIGDLKAGLLLDFFVEELGPTIYNLAVADVQAHLLDRVNDLDSVCYQSEFAYWKR